MKSVNLSSSVVHLCAALVIWGVTACDGIAQPRNLVSAQVHLDRGEGLLDREKIDLAIREFDEAIRLDPRLPRPYFVRGYAWATKRMYQKAIDDFNKAIRLDPNNALIYANRAEVCLVTRKFAQAIQDSDKAISLDLKNSVVYCNRGSARMGNKDLAGAIEDFTEALRFDGEYENALFQRAKAFSKLEGYDRAITDLNKLLRVAPNDAEALGLRAWCFLAILETIKAWETLDAFEQNVADVNQRQQLALQLEAMANSYTHGVLTGSPELQARETRLEQQIRGNIAELTGLRTEKMQIEAIIARSKRDLARAIKLDPRNALLYAIRGRLRMYQGELKDTISDMNEALRLRPNMGIAYVYRGFAQLYSSPERAKKDFKSAIRYEPNDPRWRFYFGNALASLGDSRGARAEYEKTLRVAPDFWPAKRKLDAFPK